MLNATYTDATTGLELTGSDQVVLEHRTQQAEFLDAQNGTQQVNHPGAAGGARVGYIDPGDWLRFDDINLTGIDTVSARVSAYGDSSFELRAGSPTGQLLARFAVPNQGSADNYITLPAIPIADPGETFDLYVVFTGASMDLDEFTFNGPGVTGNGTPQLDRVGDADDRHGAAEGRLHGRARSTPRARRSRTRGTSAAARPRPRDASHTYTERGIYTPTLTVDRRRRPQGGARVPDRRPARLLRHAARRATSSTAPRSTSAAGRRSCARRRAATASVRARWRSTPSPATCTAATPAPAT